ncbi:unnamed protein product [Parascedosporium putredinis]|uniref:Flavodoxin-like domain-containing protein n=1 Tax=Parascedosporium putredinis TaxID=1442378 RepID=A0A9P1H221_9PEZI|nr:unnamed protein product [Parascedosporium putredinis]CAI7994316.1 unnamed protein product [Parascedosporium putredinis]
MAPKIAIVYYSMYGHIKQLAEAEKRGIEKAGGTADLYQIPETLSDEVLGKMHAAPKATDVPVLNDPNTLAGYDAFLLGIPTRYGNFLPSGRPSGIRQAAFGPRVASMESWLAFLSPLALWEVVRGGSPWGAGTFAAADGSRQPSSKELEVAEIQGQEFFQTTAKHFG